MAPLVVAGSLGVSTLLWALRLALPGNLISPQSAVLFALDLLVVATVAITGLLVAHGRWAKRLGWVTLAMHGVAAAISDPDTLWWFALIASAVTAAAWAGPWLRGWVRLLPAAAGPPSRAVLLVLGLVLVPAVVALTNPSGPGWQGWLLAIGALGLAFFYARAVVPALWLLRVGLIPLSLPAVIAAPPWGAVALGAMVIALTWLSWTADARLAVAPLVPQVQRSPEVSGPVVLPRPRLRRRNGTS